MPRQWHARARVFINFDLHSHMPANGTVNHFEPDVIVLGAGLAGLACGYELCKRGMRVLILERESHVGGMAGSFEEGDRSTAGEMGSDYFSYDFGPHRFHTNDKELMEHIIDLLGENFEWRQRLSRILLFDRFFKYPLELANVLRQIPLGHLIRMLYDYSKVRLLVVLGLWQGQDRNFAEWVESRFGRTLASLFFIEYTEKTWGIPATEISSAWARQRITLVSLGDTILRAIFPRTSEPRTLLTRFIYPKRGGIGELARIYAQKIEELGGRVLLDAPVARLHIRERRVSAIEYRTRGESITLHANHVISTIPIAPLVSLVRPRVDEKLRRAARNLRYVSIVFIYLKIRKPSVSPDNWVYLPQKQLTVHRISEFKNFSSMAAPKDKTLICAEITCPLGGEIWKSNPKQLRDIAVRDLESIGFITAEDVIDSFVKYIPHAYPLYDLNCESNLAMLMDFVHDLDDFETVGRQGLFRYNNMDQSILMGRLLGQNLGSTNNKPHEMVASEQKYFG